MSILEIGTYDEEHMPIEYERDEHNESVGKQIEEIALLAKKAGVFDQEAYDAAKKYYKEHVKNWERVNSIDSPIGEFIYGVQAKVKEMSAGKKM